MISHLQQTPSPSLTAVGWREWLALPELGITQIKAKVDTGARTSALHAFHIEYFDEGKVPMVRFQVHPLQRNTTVTITATAPVLETRAVRNSGGQAQQRPVIKTLVAMGAHQWPIELTLTNRDVMGFRMLLGREAVRHRFLVDPAGSYLLSQPATASTPVDEIDEPDLP